MSTRYWTYSACRTAARARGPYLQITLDLEPFFYTAREYQFYQWGLDDYPVNISGLAPFWKAAYMMGVEERLQNEA